MADRPRILIVQFGAIGDVVRALPLAMRLKDHWPDCHISWAIEPISRDLVSDHPAIDRVILFNRKRKLIGYLDFLSELRRYKFDLTLDLQRHLKSGLTSWMSRAPRRLGFSRANAKEFNWVFNTEYIPTVDNYSSKFGHFQLFGDLLGAPRPDKFNFGVEEKCRDLSPSLRRAFEPGGRYCGVILGSSWESRFWFEDNYVELLSWLHDARNITSILIGAKGESVLAASISARLGATPHYNLCGETSLTDLFGIFRRCEFGIGPDSGPMHIAAAAGTRIISLFGATSPLRSAPFGSEDLVLKSDIHCSPCYKRSCPRLDRACMQDLSVKIAQTACDRLLSDQPQSR
jgi:ADP-heptose:LPS heptosyltransferase